MSSTIKRQNHRIHPCNATRKNELLHHLITHYVGKSILVVTAGDPSQITLPANQNITLHSDESLAKAPDLKCDILISYDLPEKAIVYMSRFARAQEYALILLGAEDQKSLYPIETLVGRTIIQETISGFEPDFGIAVEQKQKEEAKARRAAREADIAQKESNQKRDVKPRNDRTRSDFKRDDRPQRDDKRPERKAYDAKRDDRSSESRPPRDSKPRFIGKDENGKAIFEGKTRERNHYIDGTPRTDAEKANRSKYASKPKFYDKGKDGTKASAEGGKKPSYNGDKKPYDKDAKKPFGDKKGFGEKKSFDKDGKKPFGDKKPYGDKKSYGDKKPASAKPSFETAAPKRAPRRISVKSLKPSEDKE